MSTAAQFRKIALSLEGTTQAPHFERTAFKVKRIYATLAPDGRSANFKFTPDEQELKCTGRARRLRGHSEWLGPAGLDDRHAGEAGRR